MAAAAQQARADRLQAALGFVDQVSTSAAPRDIMQQHAEDEGAGSSEGRESHRGSGSDGDKGDLSPPVLAERLESALGDVDATAGALSSSSSCVARVVMALVCFPALLISSATLSDPAPSARAYSFATSSYLLSSALLPALRLPSVTHYLLNAQPPPPHQA